MAALPKKATDRIIAGVKRFQPILANAKVRDVNESDTVVMVTDMLQEIFGYDKYTEITSEHMIRSTFCDLAVKIDGAIAFLIEVKAIGLDMKDAHVKQCVDYAANQGTEWVVLTNGMCWRVYRVTFAKPIDNELVVEIDLSQINHRNGEHIERLGLLAKEGWQKAHLGEYHSQRQALSRFTLGALLLSEAIGDAIRREVRRLAPEVRVSTEEIHKALRDEVIKREVLEGDKAEQARRAVSRAAGKAVKAKREKADASASPEPTQAPRSPSAEPEEDPQAPIAVAGS